MNSAKNLGQKTPLLINPLDSIINRTIPLPEKSKNFAIDFVDFLPIRRMSWALIG